MLFPRINNLSFWLYFLGVLFVVFSVFIEEGIGLG
jgi:heme/copper-type cytochrome/quinol oxidase subunit 1